MGQDAEMQDKMLNCRTILQNKGQLASLSVIASHDHLFYVCYC